MNAVTNGTSSACDLCCRGNRKSVYTEAGHRHSQDLLLLMHNGKTTRPAYALKRPFLRTVNGSAVVTHVLRLSSLSPHPSIHFPPFLSLPPSQFILIISIGSRWSEDEGEFPAFKTRMMNWNESRRDFYSPISRRTLSRLITLLWYLCQPMGHLYDFRISMYPSPFFPLPLSP